MSAIRTLGVTALACVLAGSVYGTAVAAMRTVNQSQITITAGKKAGIQDLYAWDKNCRALNVSFQPMPSFSGRLYTVRDRFRISGAPGEPCNGKSVSGSRVIFEPARNFKGMATVRYMVRTPNHADTFVFSRNVMVR